MMTLRVQPRQSIGCDAKTPLSEQHGCHDGVWTVKRTVVASGLTPPSFAIALPQVGPQFVKILSGLPASRQADTTLT